MRKQTITSMIASSVIMDEPIIDTRAYHKAPELTYIKRDGQTNRREKRKQKRR